MKEKYLKREQDKIQELAKEYKANGYEVVIHPTLNQLPTFLRESSYKPDLIVRSPKENLVIEVKSSESISTTRSLEEISSLINKQDKWEFIFVMTNPKEKEENSISERNISPENILVSIQKTEELLIQDNNRFNDVALLYLWSLIEATLRYGLSLSQKIVKSTNIKSLLRDSQLFGIISKKDYDFFSSLLSSRNAISHGFFGVAIDAGELDKAITVTKRILSELNREYIDEKEDNYIDYLRSLSKKELESVIDSLIAEVSHKLMDEDEVNSQIANTNAFGWYCDEYSIESIEFSESECIVSLSFHASGDQDQDKPYHGTSLSGRAEAVIDTEENIYFQNVGAALETYDDYFDEP